MADRRAPHWSNGWLARLTAAALVASTTVWIVLVAAFLRDEWARQARIDAGTLACCPPEDLGLVTTVVVTVAVVALGLAVLAVVRCRRWSWPLASVYVVALTPLAVIATGMGLQPDGLYSSALVGWAMVASGALNVLAAVLAVALALLTRRAAAGPFRQPVHLGPSPRSAT